MPLALILRLAHVCRSGVRLNPIDRFDAMFLSGLLQLDMARHVAELMLGQRERTHSEFCDARDVLFRESISIHI